MSQQGHSGPVCCCSCFRSASNPYHYIWQSRRSTVRNDKPALVRVYRFKLQTHTSQQNPFIKINTLSSGWRFLLFWFYAYLHQIQVVVIQFFLFFVSLCLWLFVEDIDLYVGPETPVQQAVNTKKYIFHSIPFGSLHFFIFANDLSVSHWSFVSKLHSLERRYLTALTIPTMKSGQKAHLAPQWDEQMWS